MLPDTILKSKYRLWSATPKHLRVSDLQTREQIATALQVDIDTVTRWEQTPDWWNGVFAYARAIIGRELGSIAHSAVQEAIAGDVSAMKLCHELLGVHSDKLELTHALKDDQLVVILRDERTPPPTNDDTT